MNEEESKARKPVGQMRRRRRPVGPFRPPPPVVFLRGAAAEHGQKQVADMKIKGEKERKEMQDLNSKLANLIDKISVLGAENKHLKGRLEIKVDFNCDKMKKLYEEQLGDLKARQVENDKKLSEIESKNESLEELVEDLSEQLRQVQDERDKLQDDVNELHDDVARRIADSETCRRRAGELEKQLGNCKDRSVILNNQMADLRAELETETIQRLESDKRNDALEDELDFNLDLHKAEIKEYEALIAKLRKQCNLQQENASDAGNKVAALSAEYEARLQTAIADLQRRHADEINMIKACMKPTDVVDASKKKDLRTERSGMSAKMGEYETEVANLKRRIEFLESELQESENKRATEGENYRTEINSLRMELEIMLKELQDLMDAKLSLELEIAAYRKLLEGEEGRTDMKSVVTAVGGFQTQAESALASALTGANKMTMSRTTSGSVSVVELATDGTYIKLETFAKFPKGSTNMKNWTLTQTLENGTTFTHKFTDGNVFSSGKFVKIWGSKHGAGQDGITSSDVAQWGTMVIPSKITLKDDKGKECATVVIKINS
ncbi:70 kDa neurofilament protein-like [Octopus sinensis]|uniref:70 kDa neurofilament protein-like n=1 Tax=Octopus sinensis TaxID=2607531 RepID=A0A6P7THF3_9MOLL|nr:70 kDa neurofilament protein-like [Octopus sinensis]